jgi:hypothetical protein
MYVFVFMWTPALMTSSKLEGEVNLPLGLLFTTFMMGVMLGANVFELIITKYPHVESWSIVLFPAAAVCLLLPSLSESHWGRVMAFLGFEVIIGVFWPSIALMRSRVIPEDIRTLVLNLFRVPLNIIVVLVLYNADYLEETSIFTYASVMMLLAGACQLKLSGLFNDRDLDVSKDVSLQRPAFPPRLAPLNIQS